MSKQEINPTYVGKNEGLVFKAPMKLFKMRSYADKDLNPEAMKELSKNVKKTFSGMQIAMNSHFGNENNHKTETSPEFWDDFGKKAKELGVDLIGYTPVNENYIFKNLKIYGKNAIVLGMEMNWEEIKKAPSVYCAIEAFKIYTELGEIVLQLTNYLKEEGYKSEAHHPFGGKMLYPYYAVAADLAIKGQIGIAMTPEFGLRQRWGIITTDADIPKKTKRDFSKLEEFCRNCGACIKNCKGGATFEKPIEKVKDSGIFTHIDRPKCMESLLNNNYCSVCLKICPKGHPKK